MSAWGSGGDEAGGLGHRQRGMAVGMVCDYGAVVHVVPLFPVAYTGIAGVTYQATVRANCDDQVGGPYGE